MSSVTFDGVRDRWVVGVANANVKIVYPVQPPVHASTEYTLRDELLKMIFFILKLYTRRCDMIT